MYFKSPFPSEALHKGYCDFVILDKNKKIIEEGFQLDDTKESQIII